MWADDGWFDSKDYSVISKVISKCEIKNAPKYSCLANKAAVAMERISDGDVPLFDGIVLKKDNDSSNVDGKIQQQSSRALTGVSRLKGVLLKFFDSHILSLDLTGNNNNEDFAAEEGPRRGGLGGGGKFRISKKEKKHFWYSMMVLLGIFGLTGPMVMKVLTLIAGKALIASKIALLMVGSVALKKIFANDNKSNGVQVHTHTVPIYDEHDRMYIVGPEHKLIYPSPSGSLQQ